MIQNIQQIEILEIYCYKPVSLWCIKNSENNVIFLFLLYIFILPLIL